MSAFWRKSLANEPRSGTLDINAKMRDPKSDSYTSVARFGSRGRAAFEPFQTHPSNG